MWVWLEADQPVDSGYQPVCPCRRPTVCRPSCPVRWPAKCAERDSGVGGIMVSIAAFQAVDPGSIPGRRSTLLVSFFLPPSDPAFGLLARPVSRSDMLALWRNGSASDSRSEGYVFKSHWGQIEVFIFSFQLGAVAKRVGSQAMTLFLQCRDQDSNLGYCGHNAGY